MLLLWGEGSSYLVVALGYALVGIGVGFAGTPASRSLTGSVPVTRAGMASGTADLQRDLGGAIMQSIFGALLTAGYAAAAAAALAGAPPNSDLTTSVQNQLTMSYAGAADIAKQYPQYSTQIIARRRSRSWPATSGPTWPASSPSSWAQRSSSSSSRTRTRSVGCWRSTRRGHRRATPPRPEVDSPPRPASTA